MPKQRVYSVHQRSQSNTNLERELGIFTDDYLADQAIDALYGYAWNAISTNTAALLWFDPAVRDDAMKKGRDWWIRSDRASENPSFFKRPHDLWNQVPPQSSDFKFTQEKVWDGVVPVVEVKKVF